MNHYIQNWTDLSQDAGLSSGAKAGIIIGSVGVAALLIIAIAILAMGGSKSSDDTYASFG